MFVLDIFKLNVVPPRTVTCNKYSDRFIVLLYISYKTKSSLKGHFYFDFIEVNTK